MPDPPGLRFIRESIVTGRYRFTEHATIRRMQRGCTVPQVEHSLLEGEIIERNPDGEPFPTCLVLGWLPSGDPVHIVCSRAEGIAPLRIVTVYFPDPSEWESDFRTRR